MSTETIQAEPANGHAKVDDRAAIVAEQAPAAQVAGEASEGPVEFEQVVSIKPEPAAPAAEPTPDQHGAIPANATEFLMKKIKEAMAAVAKSAAKEVVDKKFITERTLADIAYSVCQYVNDAEIIYYTLGINGKDKHEDLAIAKRYEVTKAIIAERRDEALYLIREAISSDFPLSDIQRLVAVGYARHKAGVAKRYEDLAVLVSALGYEVTSLDYDALPESFHDAGKAVIDWLSA